MTLVTADSTANIVGLVDRLEHDVRSADADDVVVDDLRFRHEIGVAQHDVRGRLTADLVLAANTNGSPARIERYRQGDDRLDRLRGSRDRVQMPGVNRLWFSSDE